MAGLRTGDGGRRNASPSQLSAFAAWIQSNDLLHLPPVRFERVKQHIVDTVGARLAGARLEAGVAASRFARSIGDPIGSAIIAACAHARSTEIDDIHLTSLTTPGSVVVSTVLALASGSAPAFAKGGGASTGARATSRGGHASAVGGVRLRTVNEFCAATLAGYEAMIRFGVAIDGPMALHRGVWPTHAAAAFGAAAAASRACELTAEQTVSALATALAFGSGVPVSAFPASSSRWITLGIAAANGELAARAAREGLSAGEPRESEKRRPASGLAPTTEPDAVLRHLVTGLGRRSVFDDVGLKPFATARQGLSAIEAARALVDRHSIDAADIDTIVVSLPELQRRIVDRPGLPATRLESIVGVQYQIALAIADADRFLDVDRTPPFSSNEVLRLHSKVEVRRARDLDAYYPRAWPARVTIAVGRRRFTRLVVHPHGDARRPLGWDEIAAKFERLAGPSIGLDTARRTVRAMKNAKPNAAMPALWELAS